MGAEHHGRPVGHLVQLLDEHRADGAQAVDDVLIVHDLVPDIDRCAEQVDGPFHDVDRAVYAGAEATRIGEQYLHGQAFTLVPLGSNKASSSRNAAPTVMAESAMLKAGKYARSQ